MNSTSRKFFVLHLVADALLLWLGYLWLGVGESTGLRLFASALEALAMLALACWLLGATLVFFRKDDGEPKIGVRDAFRTVLRHLPALLVAAVLAGVSGLEREIREHTAGFRTHILVAVSAAAFTLASSYGIQGTSFDDDTMRRINRIADVSAEVQAASSAGLSYAQMQQLSALRDAAKNEGAAGMGMAMAVGMGMGGIGAGQNPLAQAVQTPADDPAAKLRTLKNLLDQGLVSVAEYEAKKKDILSHL